VAGRAAFAAAHNGDYGAAQEVVKGKLLRRNMKRADD
jgi:hypothetical protein